MWVEPQAVASTLAAHHYLGPAYRGNAWQDKIGVLVFSAPTSRRLPTDWLDLTRWCILLREKNAGSRQWGQVAKALFERFPEATTVVSYSDPSVGHNGALYRACNWWWAPTWHRLRPPPSGQGAWKKEGKQEAVKDRWIFPLRKDARRIEILTAKDESVLRKTPQARYSEPGGVNFKRWHVDFKRRQLESLL
jgi:hypothetical protein